MAVTQANVGSGRSYSIGPVKQQRVTISALAADTSGTITFDALSTVESALIGTLQLTAVSFSGNVATITFTAPGVNVTAIAEGHGV